MPYGNLVARHAIEGKSATERPTWCAYSRISVLVIPASRKGDFIVLSSIAFFILFHHAMYNLFRIGVPISYLFQIGLFYFFWSYLKDRKWIYFFFILILAGPAMGRQTTPIILSAIFIAELLNNKENRIVFLRKNYLALFVIFGEVYLTACLSVSAGIPLG